eukprot:9596573-Lingulodinium_polyedra.AAC.1
MQFFLLAAGHAAGLAVSTHRCETVWATGVLPAALIALSRLPVTIARQSAQLQIAGLPPHIVEAIGQG